MSWRLQIFDQALVLNPDHDLTLFNRGLAFAAQGDTEHAIADFQRVLEISENDDLRQEAAAKLEELGVAP
jgi:tetratricopeptide (TPR) repeat protein